MRNFKSPKLNARTWSNRPMSKADQGALRKWFGQVYGDYGELVLVNHHYPLKTKLYHHLRAGLEAYPLRKRTVFRTPWGKRRMQKNYTQKKANTG